MTTDLPPEAYTKETLQAAFDWLQTQPEGVRGGIHTPEHLVSLYRKAQRLNDLDHPVSSKKFVTDLKTLASSLDQFRDGPQILETPAKPVTHQTTTVKSTQKASFEVTSNTESTTTTVPTAPALDALTNQRISEVQKRFNLSHPNEAIRLLISLGYEKFTEF